VQTNEDINSLATILPTNYKTNTYLLRTSDKVHAKGTMSASSPMVTKHTFIHICLSVFFMPSIK
jgi:hypothetical protein